MSDQPQLPIPGIIPKKEPEPDLFPGRRPKPEMPTRRGRPGRDEPLPPAPLQPEMPNPPAA